MDEQRFETEGSTERPRADIKTDLFYMFYPPVVI